MATVQYFEETEEQEFTGHPCHLCGRVPTEWTVFHCGVCGEDFWKGWLCADALRSLHNNKGQFLSRWFPNIHDCQ